MCSETGLMLQDLSKSLDLHQEIKQGLHEEETLGLARWEMEVLQAKKTAWVLALRQEEI